MKSIADQLPPDIARQIHPDRRKNEGDYWAVRDQLLGQYKDKWIGFADGAVIASGESPVAVFHKAEASGRHPFIICVGREEEPSRIRRVTSQYDGNYPGEALPLIKIEFRQSAGLGGTFFDRVIPDSGADATVMPWTDCQLLQLSASSGVPSLIGGVGNGATASLAFLVWAHVDGQDYPCRLQADFIGGDRILGRDVLNQIDILFRGPAREVVINP